MWGWWIDLGLDGQQGLTTRNDTEAQEDSSLYSEVLGTGDMPCWAIWERQQPRRGRRCSRRENLGHGLCWSFHGKGEAG